MEPPEGYEDLPEGKDAPEVDPKGHWKNEMALRVDKFILEQVEALEDKVASASMQVPGWRVPNNGEIETKASQRRNKDEIKTKSSQRPNKEEI